MNFVNTTIETLNTNELVIPTKASVAAKNLIYQIDEIDYESFSESSNRLCWTSQPVSHVLKERLRANVAIAFKITEVSWQIFLKKPLSYLMGIM